ncbi:MAG: hypothetical protein ACOC2W_02465 [bacterium]
MRSDRKEQLTKLMKKYVEGNRIDIVSFRKDNPSEYSLLSHYFGSVSDAISKNGWVKVSKRKKNGKVTLRDTLAFEMLKKLKEDDHKTYEEIAQDKGVTRPAVSQLYQALKAEIEENE